MITHVDARLNIAVDLILLNFRVTGTAACYTTALVLADLITDNVRAGIEHDDTISVVSNIIFVNPGEAAFNTKDALLTTFFDFIVHNDCVTSCSASKGNIGLVIGAYHILFYVSERALYQQDALTEVASDTIVRNGNAGFFSDAYACFHIVAQLAVFLDSSHIIGTRAENAVLFVALTEIVPNFTEVLLFFFRNRDNTVLVTLVALIKNDECIAIGRLNANLALRDAVALDFGA